MTLAFYIARRFVVTTGLVFLVFFGILVLIDMIEQLRRLADRGLGLSGALHLSLLNVPETMYRILPLILILSAIALFLALARSSELVVIRAAGLSALRFLVTPVLVALAIGALTIAVLNPLVAATQTVYEDLRARYLDSGGSALSVSDTGLWLRQGGVDGQTVIQAARANLDGTGLSDATFLTFDADGTPATRLEAKTATLLPGAWVVTGGRLWMLNAPNPDLSARAVPDGTRMPSDLTPERIRDSFGTPSSVAIWALPDYIAGLERAGFSARAYRLWLQMELAQPLLLTAMVLIAAGFTMRHVRFGGTGRMVLYAILSGFAIFVLRNFAQALGENGQIPIALAAWSPPLAATFLALGLLLHLEEG